MKVSLEFLYHFRCDRCDNWWSRADIEPKPGDRVYCPQCGSVNTVEEIQTFRNAARSACLHTPPDPEPLT
ncbi:hypothetical protein Pse7367_1229 [Thalassoporum mexicanum PCC 7367]|uniref:hypothetical protein n=1 Tax=Thalassoporum mexicanum TaxID=3457544 RepID=UPI00029FE915|nr:hypothetical protein [Pseudanabaena sp. PCC 7367]AFY69524.1 hypothetical protein Pse7367_1229 [Pseudanabaena sp. PCC 7367]